jgi:hypothetical protein
LRCALSLPANSLRRWAGGACPLHSTSDALCRSRDALPRLPPLRGAALHSSERLACRANQSRSTASRLKPTISRPRTPSIGSIPAFRLGRLWIINLNCRRPHSASTLAARSWLPACHGDGTPGSCSSDACPLAEALGPEADKMPLTNLCNRLVVNEHPLDPTILERLALTSLTAPSLAAVARPARAGVGTESSRVAPDSP